MDLLHEAIKTLAYQCDGAQEQDGAGFNKFDARFGRSLAAMPELTNGQRRAAYDMLHKYKGQLESAGINYDDIIAPEPITKRIDFNTGLFIIKFDYDAELVSAARNIPGRRWNGKENTAPLASKEAVIKFADRFGFEWTREAIEAKNSQMTSEPVDMPEKSSGKLIIDNDLVEIHFDYDPKIVDSVKQITGRRWNGAGKYWTAPISSVDEIIEFAQKWGIEIPSELQETKSQIENNLEISGALEIDEPVEIEGLGGELRPFQKVAVAYGLQNKRVLITDEMGLGKTVEALALIKAIDQYPVLIVVPASLSLNWKREAEKWLPGVEIAMLEGRKSEPVPDCDIAIINYSVISSWQDELIAAGFTVGVADESHYAKHYKSARSKALKAVFENIEYRYLLTGTPVMNRPVELDHQLQVLGQINQFGGSWKFRQEYCDAKQTRWGWDFSGASNLEKLHRKLRSTCYIRRLKIDVLTELPPKQRATIPVEIDNRKEYEKEAAEIRLYLQERAEQLVNSDDELMQEIAGLSPEEQEDILKAQANQTYEKSLQAEALVRIERLKQVAARGKMKAIKSWISDFLESDEKLILFASHRDIVLELAEEFEAPHIFGGQSVESVEQAKEKFQTDPKTRIIVCNIQAGGVGHTLTAATNVAFVELAWRPSDHSQAEDRAHRIGQEDAVTCWYFLADDTIDNDIYELLQEKAKVVDAVTDGGEVGDVKILDTIINKLSQDA